MSAWYRQWFNSPYYHKLYANRNDGEAQQFLARLLQLLKPPPHSLMLDAACGRGRYSCLLANAGFDVTGVDLAMENVRFAKERERENLRFYQQDLRLPFYISYFDYCFNFFTSFGYFDTQREHDAAMRTMAQSLKAGGYILIDYLNVHFAEARLRHSETIEADGTTYAIQRWQDDKHFFKKISITDASLNEPLVFAERVAKFSLGDFTEMLAYQNVQVTDVRGSYDLAPYDVRDTPRMIVIGRKQPVH